jgi:hypothetical protein
MPYFWYTCGSEENNVLPRLARLGQSGERFKKACEHSAAPEQITVL